jgi:hypothetical protein
MPQGPAGRPAYIVNDLFTWVKGAHTFKFGGEYRWLGIDQALTGNAAGTFNFRDGETGVLGQQSGNSFASFLLDQMDSGSSTFYSTNAYYMRQKMSAFYAGDTWKATPSLSVNFGLRWDIDTPTREKSDILAFFDPYGANPTAGGLAGREAWAGTKHGAASLGKSYPEDQFWKAFSPRLGIAYSLDPQTVIRAGYGIFYNQLFYQGWAGGANADGVRLDNQIGSSQNGLVAAGSLATGLPTDHAMPPIVDQSFKNGQGIPQYRARTDARMAYSQQWNLTVERQIGKDFVVGASYVGNKGTHLPSNLNKVNVLNPSYMAMGSHLQDIFQPGMTELDGVKVPYTGWIDQMNHPPYGGHCDPTVAQALRQFPQYCGSTFSLGENLGNSSFNSLQLKAEQRFSHGLYFTANYTWAKVITDGGTYIDSMINTWYGTEGVTSPYQRSRARSLAQDDSTHTVHAGVNYQLPFGVGRRYLSQNQVLSQVVGGWSVSSIMRANTGTPMFFRSGYCNLGADFGMACIPSQLPGTKVWLQDKQNFNSKLPVLNVKAFQPSSDFNYYAGSGPRISNERNPGFANMDLGLQKVVMIMDRINFTLRGDAFNALNLHYWASDPLWGGATFNTDISSSNFGHWNGAVTDPRVLQVSGRIDF